MNFAFQPTEDLPCPLPAGGWMPRPHQIPVCEYLIEKGGKRACLVAHRRWGKDEVALHLTAIKTQVRRGQYWHCLPLQTQAKKVIWNQVNSHTGRRRIDEAFPKELRKRTLEDEMFIEFNNGSTWQLVGSDKYDSVVGSGPAGIVLSEWALANPAALAYFQPMLEESGGWLLAITTPRGRNHAKDMFDRYSLRPDHFAEISSIKETGALTPDQIERIKQDYEDVYGSKIHADMLFSQEYLCDFNAPVMGSFYAEQMRDVRLEGRISRKAQPILGRPVHRAWDIGTDDDTSIIWFQVVGQVILILDCYSSSGHGVDHYAEVVHTRGWPPGLDYMPHDANTREWGTTNARTRVESAIAHGLRPARVPNVGKEDGINAVRRTLKQTVFHPRCDELIRALEMYRRKWDDDKKAFAPTEFRDWTTHLSDAFRYMSLSWKASPIEKPPKSEVWKPQGGVYLPGPPMPDKSHRTRI